MAVDDPQRVFAGACKEEEDTLNRVRASHKERRDLHVGDILGQPVTNGPQQGREVALTKALEVDLGDLSNQALTVHLIRRIDEW